MKKNYFKNLKNIFYIAINNLKRENKATSLGFVWLLFNPLVEAFTYTIIFGILYKGSVDGVNKVPWVVVGSFTWSYLSKSFLSGMDSFYTNKHLVTKLKFPLQNVPLIHVVMELLRFGLFFILMIPMLVMFKIYPSINYLLLIYAALASSVFLVGATRLFSTLGTLVKDISKFISAIFGIVFWLSGVVIDINIAKQNFYPIFVIMKLNPFEYLVGLWRDILINKNIFLPQNLMYHGVFWVITIFIYVLGTHLFNKFKGDFADIL